MAIYRGIGGAGDSTTDATVNYIAQQVIDASTSAEESAASATAAASSATNAATSATNAASSETAAAASAAAAAASETAAADSETAAAASETAAAASEAAAAASETNAAASETAVAASAAAAATSETNAASSASAASTSATAAASSASAASTSATNAAASETAAATSETNAATSATNAASSASAAATSETNAVASETASAASASAAATSETNAASSASAASTSASNAASSATAAATSASAASASASNASTSETNAASSASSAATSASNAATSETNAAGSATSAASSATASAASASSAASSAAAAATALDSFDDRYLGAKSSAPTLDNDGNALLTGALYYDTVEASMFVYDGSQWLAASSASQAILTVYNYTATSSQTTFSGADDNAATLAYVSGSIIVTLNGLFLENGTDYTATNGTSVVLTTAAIAGDELNVYSFNTFDVANVQAIGDDRYVRLTTDQTVAGVKTLSSNPVLSGGTANGVTYLNGSKVLTSGSALTFDGTNLATTGAFNALGTIRTDIPTAGTSLVVTGTGSNFQLSHATSGFATLLNSGGGLIFSPFGSEAMRLTSTGLGIGTSSPATKLHVVGASQLSLSAAGTQQVLQLSNNDGTAGTQAVKLGFSSSGATKASINAAVYGNDYMTFNVGSDTERMRIDASGNVGIGTSSPTNKLDVSTDTVVRAGTSGTPSTGGSLWLTTGISTGGVRSAGIQAISTGASNDHSLLFYTNGASSAPSERLRIDSNGNVGIGTSSPAYKLDVVGSSSRFKSSSGDSVVYIDNSSNSNLAYINFGQNGSLNQAYFGFGGSSYSALGGNNSLNIWNNASGPVVFATSGTERLRIDSSGNLGLGVTPSAFSAGYIGFQLGGNPVIASQNNLVLAGNAYYNSGWKYIASNYASRYDSNFNNGGIHAWFTAPSGTAGNAITFTQAMTLDASGRLGIGTTSPSQLVTIAGSSNPAFQTNNTSGVSVNLYAASSNGIVGTGSNHDFALHTNNTERARIDSSGNLLVGTTSAIGSAGGAIFQLSQANNNWISYIGNSQASGSVFGQYLHFQNIAPNDATSMFLYCGDISTQRISVRSNGGIANYQANNVNLSDRNEKTNFSAAGEYLSKICAIPVQTFNYIDQNMEDDPGLTLGVVAQDVQAVAPELVMESNWGTEEEPKMRLSIYQTDLQYALMKCIQEQQAIIESLEARLDAAGF